MDKRRLTVIFLFALTGFALYLCYLLFRPFLKPMLFAFVIAVVFFPVHAKATRLIRSPSLAALLSTTLVTLIIIVPAILILLAITQEVTNLYTFLNQKSSESGGLSPYLNQLLERPMAWVGRFIDLSKFNLRDALLARLQQLSAFLLAEVGVLLGNITEFVVDAVITIFTLFFLFREGKSMRRRVAVVLPLNPEQIEKLFSGIENTIIGTVYGGLVVAAVQGALTGLALWVFGIHSPVLWAVVAAFFALLPLVGTAIVWAPAALYLIVSGSWIKAIILIAWGAGVVGTVDNFLRPYLISGRVQMHTLLIFFAVFGGVNVFGFLGLFVGPVILAITITLLSMLRDESRTWQSSEPRELPEHSPG